MLDHLDAALAAGLVREDGVGRYLFGHALVRDDAVRAALGPTRRARMHARVAEALEPRPAARARSRGTGWPPARRTPAQAWRAARAAAEVARRVHAYGEAARAARAPRSTPMGRTPTPRAGTATTC